MHHEAARTAAVEQRVRRRCYVLMSAIVVVDSVFFAVMAPMLPYYGSRFHLSETTLGVLSGAYAAGTLLGSLPAGWLGARWDARRLVLLGLALLAAASLVFAWGNDARLLIVARLLQGLGGACSWTGALVWVVSLAQVRERGRVIGQVMGLGFAGALVGPVLGAVARQIGPVVPFGVIAMVGLVLVMGVLRTPAPPRSRPFGYGPPAPGPMRQSIRGLALVAMGLMGLAATVAGALSVMTPLRLDDLGADGAVIGITFLCAGGLQALGQLGVGTIVDGVGPFRPIRVTLLLGAGLLGLLPLLGSVPVLAVVTVGAVVAYGVIYTPATAMLSRASAELGLDQALAFSMVNVTWAGGQMAGAVLAGKVVELSSSAGGCLALAGTSVAVAFALGGRDADKP